MTTNAADWMNQWRDALAGARAGLSNYELIARRMGIDEDNRNVAVQQLATAVVQTALLAGLAWTEHDGGAETLARARHVLNIATLALDGLEAARKSRH